MQTQHYGFKLFEAPEKPTWLTDWNTTMNKIDSTIARLTGGGGDTPDLAELTQRVQALEGRVDSDELRLNVVEGDIVDMLQTLSDVQTALSQAQSDIVANKTYSDAQIGVLTDDVTDIRTSIGSLTTSLSALSTRVGDCETNITGLEDRVTALEGAGGGGMSITKIGNLLNYTPIQLNSLLTDGGYDLLLIGGCTVHTTYQDFKLPTDIIDKDHLLATNTGIVLCRLTLNGYDNVHIQYIASNSGNNFTFYNSGSSSTILNDAWVFGVKF